MKTVCDDIALSDWFDWADEDETGRVVEAEYDNGRTALMLRGEHGEPIADLTVNLPKLPVGPNKVVVNDAAETEGILEPMVQAGIVEEPDRTVQSGFNEYPVCEYTMKQDDDVEDYPEISPSGP